MRINNNNINIDSIHTMSSPDSSTNTSLDVTPSDDIRSTSDAYVSNDVTSAASSNDAEQTLVLIEEEEEEQVLPPKERFKFDSNIDSVKTPAPPKKVKPKKVKKPIVMYETGYQTYMSLSVVVSVCFNLPIGILAFLVAVKSSDSFKEGNVSGGHARARCSMVISMLGIVVTVTVIMAVVFYMAKKQREMQYRYG